MNKEMAKIRKKFKEEKNIIGYDKKKYVAKILYMYMLGYELDFGYMEAVALLSSNKFQEKLIVSIYVHQIWSILTPFVIISRSLGILGSYHPSPRESRNASFDHPIFTERSSISKRISPMHGLDGHWKYWRQGNVRILSSYCTETAHIQVSIDRITANSDPDLLDVIIV